MLVDLKVKNYALINKLEINLEKGLNVMTGETGAGKSIIIGALEILLGGRASTDLIRKGKESAYIEASFLPEKVKDINKILNEAGIEIDPDMVLLSREIRQNNRNRSRINGQLATVGMIRKVSRYLVDIHGQHEHQRLLDSKSQLMLLDEYINNDIKEIKANVENLYIKINEINEQLVEVNVDEAEKAREIDLLEFQINEIERANLQQNEIEKLEKEHKILSNMEDIYGIIGKTYNGLSGDDYNSTSVLNQLGSYMKEMETLKEFDEQLAEFYKIIKDCYFQLEDLSYQLNEYHQKLEFDQTKLDKINNRLGLLTTLQRKYGKSVKEIIEYKDKMKNKLENLKSKDKIINNLKKQKENVEKKYYKKANQLTKIRKEKAKHLEKMIASELADLAMESIIFKIVFQEKSPAIDGTDRIQFLISPNPGEDLKPLSQIASGGELSRIMLALKTIIAHIDQVDTLIFDEVDSGVGGKTAQMMAEKLTKISINRQVLCITHLPQIASMSDKHFFITKDQEKQRTYTKLYTLDKKGKRKELARMLGGVEMTDTTMKHAQEMLSLAEDKKEKLL